MIATWSAVQLLWAHDLFLKPEEFVVRPGSQVRIWVLNGTFSSSEAAVDRNRLRDLSVVSAAGIAHPATATWEASEKRSVWNVAVRNRGTYVIGASVIPRTLKLDAKAFNAYLEEDGISDVLAHRQRRGEMNRAAREDTTFRATLGYPAELVPLDNPYRLRPGEMLRVRALVDGALVAGQVVLSGGHSAAGDKFEELRSSTDSAGIARFTPRKAGVWYVKFVNMRPVRVGVDSVDYESKWATLTFAVR